jgi:hypothetical protein
MESVLRKLRKNVVLHSKIRSIYGYTFGLWALKTWYLKKMGLYNGIKHVKLVEYDYSDIFIANKIKSGKPFMLARYGSNEFRNLFYDNELDVLCSNAGFFPNKKDLLPRFRDVYFSSSEQIDILAVWNYLNHFMKKRKLAKRLKNTEVFVGLGEVGGLRRNWMKQLKGKKILVIHPFKKTIEQQYERRSNIKILPKFKSLEVIQAVQTIAGNKDDRFETWFDALDYMKKEIDKKEFDIALIGCGAYGLPLAAYVKSIGKQAIHLGGGLQLLFGITGERWLGNNKVKTNKYWTRPLDADTPKNNKKVENGCYW